jgi:hypothetical protein
MGQHLASIANPRIGLPPNIILILIGFPIIKPPILGYPHGMESPHLDPALLRLHAAIGLNRVEVVQFLLQMGANTNQDLC